MYFELYNSNYDRGKHYDLDWEASLRAMTYLWTVEKNISLFLVPVDSSGLLSLQCYKEFQQFFYCPVVIFHNLTENSHRVTFLSYSCRINADL